MRLSRSFWSFFFDSAFNVVALDAIIHTDANESKEFAAQFLSAGVICSLLAFATATFVALKFKKKARAARGCEPHLA